MKKILSTLTIFLLVFTIHAQTTYYWNGAVSGSSTTLVGGTGSWTTVTTTKDWLTQTSGGAQAAWPNTTSYNASFGSTAGTVTLNATSLTAAAANFTTTGYVIKAGSSNTLTMPINLSSNVGLTIQPTSGNTIIQSGNIAPATSATGTSLTLTGSGSSTSTFELSSGNSITVPAITITNTGTAVFSLTTVSGAATIGASTGTTTFNQTTATTAGTSPGNGIALLGTGSTGSITLNGTLNSTGSASTVNLIVANSTHGGAGSVILNAPTSGANNNLSCNIYMAATATLGSSSQFVSGGTLKASGSAGYCGVPPTAGLYFVTPAGTNTYGGAFDLNGTNVTVGALSSTVAGGAGIITNNGTSSPATFTVNQPSSIGSTSFNLIIQDGTSRTSFVKSNTGTLTLTAANTYSGTTGVTGGSLFVNGSIAGGAVSVSSGAVLGGTGTAGGTLSLSGQISPGASGSGSVGTFTTTGNQTWAASSSYYCDIASASSNDQVACSGSITFSGATTLDVDGTLFSGFSSTTGYIWPIFSASSFTGLLNVTINPTHFGTYTGTFSLMTSGNVVNLVYTPSGPFLWVSPSSLSGFTTNTGIASSSQSYSLWGTNLTAGGGTITVTAPSGYEISQDNINFYASSASFATPITYTGTSLASASSPVTIYVRIAASTPSGTVTGNVTNAGGGATTENVALTGSVTLSTPTVQATNVLISSVNAGGFTANWTNGNGQARIVVVYPTASSAVAPTNGTTYTASTVYGNNTAGYYTGSNNYVVYNNTGTSVTVTGLAASTYYTVQVYEYNGTGGSQSFDVSAATVNPSASTETSLATYYWNGASPSTSTGLTAGGGAGTWNTTIDSWVEPVDPGTGAAYPSSTPWPNVVIGGTAGTGTITQSASVTAASISVTTSGYNLSGGGNITAAGGISLGQNVNLKITPGAGNTPTIAANVTQAASTTGGSLTLNSGANASSAGVELGSGNTISVPLTITNTGSQPYGLASTSGNSATVSNTLILNQGTGAGNIFLGGSGTGGLLTINGLITGTGNIVVANAGVPASGSAYGGKGTLALVPPSGGNNFAGDIYMAAGSTGTILAGSGGISGIPSTSNLYYTISGNGGIFDLNGCDVTISSLTSSSGAVGTITNNGTGTNTLTIEQNTNTSFGLVIADATATGGTGKTAVTKSGTGTLSISGTNTFSGDLTLSGGLIQWGASGNLIANSDEIVFNGGGISTGATTGTSETVGAMKLKANSSIYLAPGATSTTKYQLNFTDSHTKIWTTGTTLTIYGWVGTPGSSGTQGQVFVGTDNTGLTTAQLDAINFNGYSSTGAIQLTTGEIVPAVPAYTWTGTTSTAWATVTNWSPTAPAGGPHACTADVIIPVVSTNYPIVSTAISVGNITVKDGATLTLNASLSSCLDFTGGTTTAASVLGTAPLILNSTTGAQTLSGIANINYLTIDNTSGSGVSSSGSLTVNNGFVMTKGNFTNTGTVTLASNSGGDAYYDDFTSTTAGSYAGNMTVQRYISSSANGYRDISSPVATDVSTLTAGNSFAIVGTDNVYCYYSYNPYPNVQRYDEWLTIAGVTESFNEHWVSYTGSSNPLTAMLGVAARTDIGGPFTFNFIGAPHTGSESIAITDVNDGWNLVGNPYPSPIKWSSVATHNSGISGYYAFITSGDYAGSWASYVNGVSTLGATGTIPIGQGFFILAPAAGTFAIDNTVRTDASADPYLAPAPLTEVRLMLSNAVNKDEIVAYTDSRAAGVYDQHIDALKIPAGSTASLAYTLSDTSYAIKALDTFTQQTVLPLTIVVADTGSYTLTPENINVNGMTAYLRDAQNPQNITYTSFADGPITLYLNGGQLYSGRYSVVFEPTSTTGIATTQQSTTKIYSYGSTVYVNRSSSDAATISVVNLLGQNMAELNSHSQQMSFGLPAIQPWYAIVKVTEGEKVTVAKVLISNK